MRYHAQRAREPRPYARDIKIMDLKRFKKTPVLGILRGISFNEVEPLMETAAAAGLEAVEITMNTADAPRLIRQAVRVSKNKLMIGAGTVTDMKLLKSALNAGATFIVLPVLIPKVVKYCVKRKIPVFPGALTPQEIYNARAAGATMVKVFPAGVVGPEYFKEIKGPFNEIELLACGGVTPENITSYFLNGASAVAIGGSVFRREWMIKKDFNSIKKRIKDYLTNWRTVLK